MYGGNYFGATYFAPTYFGRVVGAVVAGLRALVTFVQRMAVNVDTLPRVMQGVTKELSATVTGMFHTPVHLGRSHYLEASLAIDQKMPIIMDREWRRVVLGVADGSTLTARVCGKLLIDNGFNLIIDDVGSVLLVCLAGEAP